jgi:type IV pilus assembly protein PilF
LQQGLTEQAKAPLGKAWRWMVPDADAHAALALVFQAEGEPRWPKPALSQGPADRSGDTRIRNNYGSFLYAQGDLPRPSMFRLASRRYPVS